jgi:hypothetical protein
MFSYSDMAEAIAPLTGRNKEGVAALKTRIRNFRAKGLIEPIFDDERESLDEQLFNETSLCAALIFSVLSDFGLTSEKLHKVRDYLTYRDMFKNRGPVGQVNYISTNLELLISKIRKGETAGLLYVANVGNEISVIAFRDAPPVSPHIVVPLDLLMQPLLDLKSEG